MSYLSGLSGLLGYESLPNDVRNKSFYELSAQLPGKERTYDFVCPPPLLDPFRADLVLDSGGVEREGRIDREYG